MTPAKLRLAQAAMAKRDTKVGDLCKELGVTRQTLYRFVDPKGELRADGTKLLKRKGQSVSLRKSKRPTRGHLKVCALNNANSDKMRTCDHSTERQISVPAAQHIVRFLGYY
jgi:hypothetical protein